MVVTDIRRADAAIVDALAEFGSATVHEAMGRIGYAGAGIRPIQQDAAISGSAITVLAAPGDNLMVHAAIEQAQSGDVIVVVPVTDSPFGFIGELMATQMQVRGVRAYVTSGGVRDTAELRRDGLPGVDRPHQRSRHGQRHRRVGQRSGGARRRRGQRRRHRGRR